MHLQYAGVVDELFEVSCAASGGPVPAGPGSGSAGSGNRRVDVVLRVHVQPAAGRTAVVGRHGESLKVRVAAPPQGGRANEACRELLSETFGLAASKVTLSSGASSRMKRFRLEGVELAEFRRRLERVVSEAGARGGGGPGSRRPAS